MPRRYVRDGRHRGDARSAGQTRPCRHHRRPNQPRVPRLALPSPSGPHDGCKARLYVDAEASAEQRRELEAIFGGKRGGVPQNVFGGVITQWLQPSSVRIDVQSGDSPAVTVGEVGRVALKRLKDGARRQTKVQGAAAQAAFEIDTMDVASSKGSRWSDPELRVWEGDSGNVMAFGWKG